MGRAAKANAARRDEWTTSLTADENVAREAAENLLRRFIIPSASTGMCYRMTFLLHLYLTEKSVPSRPVVGWVTDGRDDIAISHAWVEVNAKKIDLTLGRVNHESMVTGEVLILDNVVTPGAQHHYFVRKGPEHLDADALMESQPTSSMLLAHKNAEHEQMLARASDDGEMRKFLDGAPDGWTYNRLKAVIDGQDPRKA